MTVNVVDRSGKSKTYFCVRVNDKLRRLISVREGRSHNDLTIIIQSGNYFDDETPQIETTEQRYSIHESPESKIGTNLIKHTMFLENGKSFRSYLLTSALKSKLRRSEIIFTKLCHSFNDPRFDIEIRKKDRYLIIADINSRQQTLMCGVAVSRRMNRAFGASNIYRETTADFKEFSVHVAHSICNLPSSGDGYLGHRMTLSPRVNDEVVPLHPEGVSEGLTRFEARDFLIERFNEYHDHKIAEAQATLNEGGIPLSQTLFGALQELGPGLLTYEQFVDRSRQLASRREGILPIQNHFRKIRLDRKI